MINLLPQPYQKKLAEEKIFKALAVLMGTVMAALLSFSLILGLLRVYYWEKAKAAEVSMAGKGQEAKIFDTDAIEKKIISDNEIVARLAKIYRGQIRIGDIFRRISEAVPEGVKLTSFGFSSGKISLAGYAETRDGLAEFKANLEGRQEFKDVIFPPESWIAEKNIEFTAAFTYGI